MNARRLAFISLLLALALAACAPLAVPVAHSVVQQPVPGGGDGATTGPTKEDYANNVSSGVAPVQPPVDDLSAQAARQSGAAPQDAAAAAGDRLVVKNASLSLVVGDPSNAVDRITALVSGMNGYVVNSSTSEASVDSRGNKIMQASLTVRVPSAQLDAALAQIRALAVEVKSVNVTGQDVTAQYTDLQSQLNNAEAAETKLQQIMDAATKTEDVMAVFNQLITVRQQVETLKGQIQYYDDSVKMASISMDLIPDALNQPIEVGGWQPQGVAKDALESLVRAFQGLATGVIWIGLYVLPLVLVIGLPLYALLRLAVRRIRRPKVVAA